MTRTRSKSWAKSEAKALLERLRGSSLFIVAVSARTGMRRGEMCALRWGDVDLAAGIDQGRAEPRTEQERRIADQAAKEQGRSADNFDSGHGRRGIAQAPPGSAGALARHRARQAHGRHHRARHGIWRKCARPTACRGTGVP